MTRTTTQKEAIKNCLATRLSLQTPSLLCWLEQLAIVTMHDVPILLTGETGTGKTYLARLIHHCSPRKHDRFLTVACGALAPHIVESELFGHARGAFTGADRPKVGKFEAAGAGTIFLDEIDTLTLKEQAGLLRILETGEYEPVGSNETRVSKARLIVASNWDLDDAVKTGKFRQDLYYRLHIMAFHLRPLRERLEDIDPLVMEMISRFTERFHKRLQGIGPQALEALRKFPWPGNIRQLENALQQAVLVSSGTELQQEDLPEPVQRSANGTISNRHGSLLHNREVAERGLIKRALENNNHRRSRAAAALGVSRVTLYKKMKKYGLLDPRLAHPPSEWK